MSFRVESIKLATGADIPQRSRATGGDGFAVLNNGKGNVGGDLDIDAMIAWFAAGAATRISLYDSTK